tara:strand:- start:1175 stop:1495 length:321 start_codon:yes stop_codon:yes gene_type:complete
MKQIITIGALCCAFASLGAVAFSKKSEVVVETITVSHQKKEIPVTVTLTKYQLEKMLTMLEEENGHGLPAAPQDKFTFTSVARETTLSADEYSISSTHLAKKPYNP